MVIIKHTTVVKLEKIPCACDKGVAIVEDNENKDEPILC